MKYYNIKNYTLSTYYPGIIKNNKLVKKQAYSALFIILTIKYYLYLKKKYIKLDLLYVLYNQLQE